MNRCWQWELTWWELGNEIIMNGGNLNNDVCNSKGGVTHPDYGDGEYELAMVKMIMMTMGKCLYGLLAYVNINWASLKTQS